MKISLRRALHIFGSFLGIAGVIFVIIKLNVYADQLDFSRFNFCDWGLMSVFSVIYGVANVLLGFAWFDLLVFLGVGAVSRRWAVKVYGLSQLAKYVPGNIFHLAGRQAYGMAAGIPAIPLAKSSALELGLIAAVGGLFSILLVPIVFPELPSLAAVGFLWLPLQCYQSASVVSSHVTWHGHCCGRQVFLLFRAASSCVFWQLWHLNTLSPCQCHCCVALM